MYVYFNARLLEQKYYYLSIFIHYALHSFLFLFTLPPPFHSTGCSEKNMFFFSLSDATFPSPTYRCKRFSKLSTQCECTVTPIGWPISVTPIAAECLYGREIMKILGKNTIFPEHPVLEFSMMVLF